MIGKLLRPIRSGPAGLAGNDPRIAASVTLELSSPDFASGTPMPQAYRGLRGVSPPLVWTNVPPVASELVLIVEDVDVPFPAPLVHAIAYGIDPARGEIDAGEIPPLRLGGPTRSGGASLGKGAGLAPGWVPVTPIPGHGPHRYVFQLFELNEMLPPFAKPPGKREILDAMAEHVVAHGATIGRAEA